MSTDKDWKCECHQTNVDCEDRCRNCGQERYPVEEQVQEPVWEKGQDWDGILDGTQERPDRTNDLTAQTEAQGLSPRASGTIQAPPRN